MGEGGQDQSAKFSWLSIIAPIVRKSARENMKHTE
jgi:hypothetical protein